MTVEVVGDSAPEVVEVLVAGQVEVVEVLVPGPGGSTGPAGPAGPVGASGAAFTHRQASPSAQWTVVHNLGIPREPVLVLDSAPGVHVTTDVEHPNLNTAVLTLPSPATGWAYF